MELKSTAAFWPSNFNRISDWWNFWNKNKISIEQQNKRNCKTQYVMYPVYIIYVFYVNIFLLINLKIWLKLNCPLHFAATQIKCFSAQFSESQLINYFSISDIKLFSLVLFLSKNTYICITILHTNVISKNEKGYSGYTLKRRVLWK